MLSRDSDRAARPLLVAVLAAGMLCICPPQLRTHAAEAVEQTTDSNVVRREHIDRALENLKEDPNLQTTRTTRTLRWIDSEEKKRERPGWTKWIGQLFRAIAEGSRYLVWIVIGILLLMLILYTLRFARSFERSTSKRALDAPTHVRDLDIRPESLPTDIGAAAWTLWERGEHRGALSLLYRGLLSRLVHEHGIPIRDSSTEGDCLALAERHLPPDRREYVSALIRTWQRAVYGGENPQSADMRALCERFEEGVRAVSPTPEGAQ